MVTGGSQSIWCGLLTTASLTGLLLAGWWACIHVECVAIYTIATVELIGGVEKRGIELVPPDSAWPERFAVERGKIVAALGAKAIRVDLSARHRYRGIAAKPIIDIDLSVKDVDDEEDYLPPLAAAGYQLRVREPGHPCCVLRWSRVRALVGHQANVQVKAFTAATARRRVDSRPHRVQGGKRRQRDSTAVPPATETRPTASRTDTRPV
jgi:GrpB-like predicted nucleotidyltransferase (UPF0157 family)